MVKVPGGITTNVIPMLLVHERPPGSCAASPECDRPVLASSRSSRIATAAAAAINEESASKVLNLAVPVMCSDTSHLPENAFGPVRTVPEAGDLPPRGGRKVDLQQE